MQVTNRVGGTTTQLTSSQKLRDFNGWYHLVFAIDTTQATSSNRIKYYVNGVLDTNVTGTYPSQNDVTFVNHSGDNHTIGVGQDSGGLEQYFEGYMSEMHLIDGVQLDASYFGYTDDQTGIWKPKRYTYGNYGTHGFHLEFKDNLSTSALGKDTSGNGNNFTSNNFSVSSGLGNDSFEDTPTNNFPTLNPNHAFLNGSSSTAENGNLQWNGQSNNQAGCPATLTFPSTGKWYWEVKLLSSNSNFSFGIVPVTYSNVINPFNPTGSISYAAYGSKGVSGVETSSWAASFSNSDTAAAALDMDSKKITFYKNNSAVGSIDLVSGYENVNYLAWIKGDTQSQLIQGAINFGGNGFVYTPPTGFKALNSNNLVPHSPLIIRPQRHFDTLLYTATGNAMSVTGLEFKPDLIWQKRRDSTGGSHFHYLFNSVRGGRYGVQSNTDGAEFDTSNANNIVFKESGFDMAASSGGQGNASGGTYVAWCWKAGGSSNTFNVDGVGYATAAAAGITEGSITPTGASVNTEQGFSIITYTGNGGSGQYVPHGLNETPVVIFHKNLSNSANWLVRTTAIDGTIDYAYLNTTAVFSNAGGDYTNAWTSTKFSIGSDSQSNTNTDSYIAYCWHEVPGYSKFGTYTGNGLSNGSFLYLGFRPALVLIKRVDSGYSWYLIDNKRDPENPVHENLYANDGMATYDYSVGDFLSTGIKFRNTGSDTNSSGATMMYMAWAEQPGTTPFGTFPNGR